MADLLALTHLATRPVGRSSTQPSFPRLSFREDHMANVTTLDEYLIVAAIEKVLRNREIDDAPIIAIEIYGRIEKAVEAALTRQPEPTPNIPQPWVNRPLA